MSKHLQVKQLLEIESKDLNFYSIHASSRVFIQTWKYSYVEIRNVYSNSLIQIINFELIIISVHYIEDKMMIILICYIDDTWKETEMKVFEEFKQAVDKFNTSKDRF